MRITGGELKNRRIKVINSSGLRPTSALVREAIFNLPDVFTENVSVLDLFAGSGIMGIEFLSRGAKNVVFNDLNGSAIKAIVANFESLKIDKDRTTVFHLDFRKAIKRAYKNRQIFDYIFIDPPYGKQLVPMALSYIDRYCIVKTDSIIICETEKSELKGDFNFNRLKKLQRREYGDTVITLFQTMEKL